jgi:signal transduction histidine kinase
MSYHFEINSFIEFLTAIAALSTAGILWRYRSTPGVRYLIYLEYLIAVWAVSYAFEFGTIILEKKILWSKISYFGIAYLPVFYFFFTTGFSQKIKWLTNRNLILLCIFPTIILPLVFTNDIHHLIWSDVVLDKQVNIAHYYHGIVFWIYFIYTEILIISGLFNLLTSVYKFPSFYKSQVYTLVIGSIFPVIGNLVYITDFNPFPGFDWTPVSFVITGFVVSFGIIRYRMFDLIPIARNKLLDTLTDGIIVINSEGIIEDNNLAAIKLLESERSTITGKPFIEVYRDFKNIINDFGKEEERRVEIIVGAKNKKIYDIIITPLINQNNKFSGNLAIFHDITLIKKTEEELLEINRQLHQEIEKKEKLITDLDAFAHTVAHDIKNPLSAIVSSISLVPEALERMDREMLNDLAGMIKSSAEKSIHITDELLTLARVGIQNVPTTPLKMDIIFTEVKIRLFNFIKEKKIVIEKPNSWPLSIGYASWIEEVWYNYLSNAIKYGGNPPKVKVGADEPENGFVRFWIKDNGDGVSPENQILLFNQFTRLNTDSEQGQGLGLSIVKRIIERFGGTVGVESSGNKGEGSLFYFTLPSVNN